MDLRLDLPAPPRGEAVSEFEIGSDLELDAILILIPTFYLLL
jgi:hypothetical protein